MKTTKHLSVAAVLTVLMQMGCQSHTDNTRQTLHLPELNEVRIEDAFWSPKLDIWRKITTNDVLNKFEGKYTPFPGSTDTRNAFRNFDRVAEGQRDIKQHDGPEWYDGLVYESIRGIADFLASHPNKELEKRIDGYVDRIYAAQQTEPTGYINTHTQLMENNHRWGDNGGLLRGQHDVYNAGMLIEAGVHYYQATGKTRLLEIATRFANYMADYMGPEPRKNIVPAHSGPEEAVMALYWLYKNEPELKDKLSIPVRESDYYNLATFWIENRGHHCGFPLWGTWGYRNNPDKASTFSMKVRIPGWAQGTENPYDLYQSNLKAPVKLKVNQEDVLLRIVDGYAEINREWKKGDHIELELPMQPRLITANKAVENLRGQVALASGPIIYCFEDADNPELQTFKLQAQTPLELSHDSNLLNGVNIIKCQGDIPAKAIPYYAVANREESHSYKVWIPQK